MNWKKVTKSIINVICIISIICILIVCMLNEYVISSTKKQFFKEDQIYEQIDCILVLGAGVKEGKPTPMLKDRLDKAIELYQKGYTDKIIMSGDHGREDYDEVNVMKKYAIEKGVPSSAIFMDHAGFSTYDSIYRAKEIFEVKKMFVVTQEYHLYRALFIAKFLELDAIGVPTEYIPYKGQSYRDFRELLARNKDLLKSLTKPPSTYLGKTIPVTGDGNITND